MAKWKLSPAFTEVHETLGNMVFYDIDGTTHARSRPSEREITSPVQLEVNHAFASVARDWKYLKGVIQDSWGAVSDTKKRRSGYTLFIGANVPLQKKSDPIELSRPLGELPLASFNARAGSAPGEIACEFSLGPANAGRHVTFFTQRKENGHAGGEIARVDGGADAASPYTLKNLEPGGEYYVYAVVTDKAYAEAKTVSLSRGDLAAAAV